MVSANLVKQLREKTGAGMMDCKKALVESDGNFEAAEDWLKSKGLSAAAKKADRVTAEGLTGIYVSGKQGAVVELNSETDFVARNENFQSLLTKICNSAINSSNIDDLKLSKLDNGKTVEEEIKENIAVIGENINLRRMDKISVSEGVISSYVHNHEAPNMGKISVLVAFESGADKQELKSFGRQIAMHIAAMRPQSLDISSLDQNLVERERNIFKDQARASGKPENIIEKMVEGRVRKFYEEVVLEEQIFVIDGKTKIKDALKQKGEELGSPIKLTSFVRFELGEGIEVEESDFASEVEAVKK